MKTLKHIFYTIGILLLLFFNGNAQTITEYAKKIDTITQYLDKTPITSGILYDRAPHYALLTLFNQFGRVDTSSTEHFLQACYEMQQSAYNNSGFTNTGIYRNTIVTVFQLL